MASGGVVETIDLVAEYDRLRKENERLREQLSTIRRFAMNGEMETIVEAEIERLREALQRLAELDEFVNGEPTSIEEVMNYAQFVARAALEEKE